MRIRKIVACVVSLGLIASIAFLPCIFSTAEAASTEQVSNTAPVSGSVVQVKATPRAVRKIKRRAKRAEIARAQKQAELARLSEANSETEAEELNSFLDERLRSAQKASGYTPYLTLYFYKSDNTIKLYEVNASKIAFDHEAFRKEFNVNRDKWWKYDLACIITGQNGQVVVSEDKLIGMSFNPAHQNDDITFVESNEALKMRITLVK